MKKQSRTVPRRRQSVSPTPRHLPLVPSPLRAPRVIRELVSPCAVNVVLGRRVHQPHSSNVCLKQPPN